MCQKLHLHAAAALLIGILAAACRDLPTESISSESTASLATQMGTKTSNNGMAGAQFICYTTEQTKGSPGMYDHGRVSVSFPTSAIPEDGSTQVYRYRLIDEDASPLAVPYAAANCRIPNTPKAVQFMDRRLGVDRRRKSRIGGEGDLASQQSWPCPTEGCLLEGIIAYGYRYPPPGYPTDDGWDGTEDPWSTWGDSYSYMGSNEYPEPYEPNVADPCNTGDVYLDDPVIGSGMNDLWQRSNADAMLLSRKEQLGWIVRTATGYRIQYLGEANFCGGDFDVPNPPEGEDAIVGFIHTHPYTKGENIVNCQGQIDEYKGVASDIDRETSVALGKSLNRPDPLPGMILDASGIRVFQGEDTGKDVNIQRCSY